MSGGHGRAQMKIDRGVQCQALRPLPCQTKALHPLPPKDLQLQHPATSQFLQFQNSAHPAETMSHLSPCPFSLIRSLTCSQSFSFPMGMGLGNLLFWVICFGLVRRMDGMKPAGWRGLGSLPGVVIRTFEFEFGVVGGSLWCLMAVVVGATFELTLMFTAMLVLIAFHWHIALL